MLFTLLYPLITLPLTIASFTCRPEGPVLPKPSTLSKSPIFASAAANLSHALTAAVSGDINAGWPVFNVSFSLGLVSGSQADPTIPLWEYHHLAEGNTRGTKKLDRDSQYLIGSVSKVISDYILLATDVDINAPVMDFLPELGDEKSRIRWSEVSLRMLASHLSGAPANYGFSEYYYLKDALLAWGFPPLKDSAYPPCGVIGLNGDCNIDDFLHGMITSDPVTNPMERPAYSNVAFTMFMMAIEHVTGRKYTQLVDQVVSTPLGLFNTFPSPGDDEKAVIPPGENSWGSDYQYNAPGGGLVSCLSDLGVFAHALLSRNLSLTLAQHDAWLKPVSFTGSLHSASGSPWEIFRADDLTPEHPHVVNIYAKGGGAMSYRSHLAVVDEYGVGIVILTAGPMHALTALADAVVATLLPAIDEVSRVEAEESYARTFTSTSCNSSTSATLTLDNDSLVLTTLTHNKKDILEAIISLWNLTMGVYVAPISPTIRVFPSEVSAQTTLNGSIVTKEVWVLWPELEYALDSDLPSAGMARRDCLAWTIGDWVHYGGEALDRVVFYRDEMGSVVGFEVPFLRSGILRPE